jgi:hypothetical protein
VSAVVDMETLTGTIGFTVIVIALEVSGLPVTQESLDVRMQKITSLFAGIYE